MEKWMRDNGVPWFIFAVKVFSVVVTARATWIVTHDPLAVGLLDVSMIALWLLLDYGGDRQMMRDFRPYAVVGIWSLFIWQLYIGWEAEQTAAAFAIRTIVAVMLAASTGAYISSLIRAYRKRRTNRIPPDTMTYAQMKFQARLRKSLNRAVRRLGSHMDVLIMDQLHDALPEMLDEKFSAISESSQITVGKISKSARHSLILSDHFGKPKEELAAIFGVHVRTIENDLKELIDLGEM